ncbi:hypothetical protein IL306_013412 [Fusarium sp. DS 682]|nr:hypothetical protein IL306_013412 [Fusarium sp. DS 682]
MSSRQPNMANMAQGNTKQRVARQQQNSPFIQNGNGSQFNNLHQQQQFALFLQKQKQNQSQNQNQMTGGFASLAENANNNTNSHSPMVVGSHHFNPQMANNSSATPDMTMGNFNFDCFTQSQTPIMSNQDQVFGDMQNSFTMDAQMPLVGEFSMQSSLWQTPHLENVQTALMDNVQASAMNNSQGFAQQMPGLRANAASFTPTQNSSMPQQPSAFMTNMHFDLTSQLQLQMQMQEMQKELSKKDEIINGLTKQQSGSFTQSNPQHGPAPQMKRGSQNKQRKQQRKTPTTQVPSPQASIPGTPATQSHPTQSSVVQTAITQTSTVHSPALPSPITVASSNEPQATQSPTAEFSGPRDGNTMQVAKALVPNQRSVSSGLVSHGPQRNSSLDKVSKMVNSALAQNPNARLLPQDVRPPGKIAPSPSLEVFLSDETLKVNIPKRSLGEESSTTESSPSQDSSVEKPSTPSSSTGVAVFQDPSEEPAYPPGLFAPIRSDGPEKLTPKEKKIRKAEDNGERIFPSQRRLVRIEPQDPRLVHNENGCPITPEGDDYNIYYLPGPTDLSGDQIDTLVKEFRAEKAAMAEAVKNGESIEKFKPKRKSKAPKTPKKPSTPRKPRVPKPPSENIVNKKRRKSTVTSTPSVAGDAQLPATTATQPPLNNSFIAQASDDPFITQTNTAFPAQLAGGDFTQQPTLNFFSPQVIHNNDFIAQAPCTDFTQPTTGGDTTTQLTQDNGFTSQATNEDFSAQPIPEDGFTSQSYNSSNTQLTTSEDVVLQSTVDLTMVNDDDFEIPADLDPMFVDASNTTCEALPLNTESFTQHISSEIPSPQSPLAPVSGSGAAQASDVGLGEVAKWLNLQMFDDGQSRDASAIACEEQPALVEVDTSKPSIIDPSLSLPVQDNPFIISESDSLSVGEKNTRPEPFAEIESMFPQDGEQSTQLRKVSNELDRPLPEETDITAFVAEVPNPYNRDLDAERVALIERFRAGVILDITDRNLLLLIAQYDHSIDVDAVDRQTAGLPQGVAPADMPGWGDDVPENIFDSLCPIPEDNLRDPSASTGNDITMFPVAGSGVTGPTTATSNQSQQPNTTWPPASPSVSLADMPYSPVLAPRETIAPAFQPSQNPVFHPRDPYNAVFGDAGDVFNPD